MESVAVVVVLVNCLCSPIELCRLVTFLSRASAQVWVWLVVRVRVAVCEVKCFTVFDSSIDEAE